MRTLPPRRCFGGKHCSLLEKISVRRLAVFSKHIAGGQCQGKFAVQRQSPIESFRRTGLGTENAINGELILLCSARTIGSESLTRARVNHSGSLRQAAHAPKLQCVSSRSQ